MSIFISMQVLLGTAAVLYAAFVCARREMELLEMERLDNR